MNLAFEDLLSQLKRRFPFLMLDSVLEVEPGVRIKAVKKIADRETLFLGHFPGFPIVPGILIVEAIGQCATALFSVSTRTPLTEHEYVVLATVNDMKFFVPVRPGQTMAVEVRILKMTESGAFVEALVTVDETMVGKGKLGFGRIQGDSKPDVP